MSLVDRYDWLDALEDFILDSGEYVEIADEAVFGEGLGVDLEAFLESHHPDVLREFEVQYRKDRKEIEHVA